MPKNNYPTFKNRSGIGSGQGYQSAYPTPTTDDNVPYWAENPSIVSAIPRNSTDQHLQSHALNQALLGRYFPNDTERAKFTNLEYSPENFEKDAAGQKAALLWGLKQDMAPGLDVPIHEQNKVYSSEGQEVYGTTHGVGFADQQAADNFVAAKDMERPGELQQLQRPEEHDPGVYINTNPKIYGMIENPPWMQVSTYPHEIAHFLDKSQQWRSENPGALGPGHHQYFGNFEPEFAQTMDAQRAIEQGIPVREMNPSVFTHYPWLQNVQPLSSQKLATPWDAKF